MRQHAAAGCMQRRTASVGCGLIHHIIPTVRVAMQAAGAKAAPGWRGPKRRAPRAAVAWPPQPQCSEGGAPVRLGPTAAAGTGTCSGQQGFEQGVHHRITSRVLNATLQSVTTDWLLVLQSTDHAKAAGPWRFCSRSSGASEPCLWRAGPSSRWRRQSGRAAGATAAGSLHGCARTPSRPLDFSPFNENTRSAGWCGEIPGMHEQPDDPLQFGAASPLHVSNKMRRTWPSHLHAGARAPTGSGIPGELHWHSAPRASPKTPGPCAGPRPRPPGPLPG
jgi:hypothetical protein